MSTRFVALAGLMLASYGLASEPLPSSALWKAEVEQYVSALHRSIGTSSDPALSELRSQVAALEAARFTTQGVSQAALATMGTGAQRSETYVVTTQYIRGVDTVAEHTRTTALVVTRDGGGLFINRVLHPEIFFPR